MIKQPLKSFLAMPCALDIGSCQVVSAQIAKDRYQISTTPSVAFNECDGATDRKTAKMLARVVLYLAGQCPQHTVNRYS